MRFLTATALVGGSCLIAAMTPAAPPAPGSPTAENIKTAAPAAAVQFTPQNGYTGDLTLLNQPARRTSVAPRVGLSSTSSSKRSEDVAPPPPGTDPLRFDQQLQKPGPARPLLDAVNRGKNGAVLRFVPAPAPEAKGNATP